MQDGYIDEQQEISEREAEERQSVTIAQWAFITALVIGLFGWIFA